jgi:hypothetical protein
MYASGKTTYDALVEVWHEKLRRQRAANFPANYPNERRDVDEKANNY